MKNWVLPLMLFAGLTASAPPSQAEDAARAGPICIYNAVQRFLPLVRAQKRNDKFMHCSASCILTLACGPLDAWNTGVLKELYDIPTPGDCDWKDLRADARGVREAMAGRARSIQSCFDQCVRLYPEGNPDTGPR